jgi:leader peptidase (prepilin peptidase) / N-methyltransferase
LHTSPRMIAPAFFALLCIASAWLAWIDLRRGIIPDWLNLFVALLGIARAALLGGSTAALTASADAIAVGAVVWLLRWLYFRLRQFQGLGLGDVKLLAASAIWVGIAGVPMQLLIASLSALAATSLLHLAGRTFTRQTSLPFGPSLAFGLLATLAIQQAGWID